MQKKVIGGLIERSRRKAVAKKTEGITAYDLLKQAEAEFLTEQLSAWGVSAKNLQS